LRTEAHLGSEPDQRLEHQRTSALGDIRVLDLGRVLSAPYAGQILGDLGAEVIKVERPRSGDEARRYGVSALPDAKGERSGDTSFYLAANRNKKSVTLDLSGAAGQQVLRSLAARSDVLIENFRVGTMARFGLGYDDLRQINPRLIYCSLTGYGQTGPNAARPGYDAVFQAQSGLMNVTGERDGPPVKAGPSIVDVSAGMNAVIAILAALRHRDHTGQGQHVDIALLDTAIALTSHSAMEFLIGGETLPRNGNFGNGGAPSQTLPCRDATIYVTAGTQQQFERLCEVLGVAEIVDDPRFASSPLRFEHRCPLDETLSAASRTWAAADLDAALAAAGVPAGVVNDYRAVFDDPQVRAREMQVSLPHPVTGSVSLIGSPLRLSATPIVLHTAPPALGADNEAVYGDLLGLSPDEIAAATGGE
jgi:crotonobetainyl-CoA:carnitine CoA-transferase CaiB-like acyl-CoA transferase